MNPQAFLPLTHAMLEDRYAAAERHRLLRHARRQVRFGLWHGGHPAEKTTPPPTSAM